MSQKLEAYQVVGNYLEGDSADFEQVLRLAVVAICDAAFENDVWGCVWSWSGNN